jgi:hypothetical protein
VKLPLFGVLMATAGPVSASVPLSLLAGICSLEL